MPPDLVDERLQLRSHLFQRGEVGREGILRTDRLTDAIGPNRSLINATGDSVVVSPGLSEMRLQEFEGLIPNILTGSNAKPVELRRSRRTYTVEFADRQCLHKRRSHPRRDHILAIRLALIGASFARNLS